MNRLATFFLVLFCFLFQAHGQTAESIRTGRPGQAIGPYVLGTGILQWQAGFDRNQAKLPGLEVSTLTQNNVVRWGLSESFEISSVIDYSHIGVNSQVNPPDQEGISQFQLGFRYNLITEPKGWIPAIGFQTRFRLRQVGSPFQAQEVAPVHLLALGHQLTDTIGLNSNFGMAYDGNQASTIYSYVFSFSQSFGERWSACYEVYGNERNTIKNNYLGLGLAYLMNNNFQWDGYISSGSNSGFDETYISLGFSWRGWLYR